MIARLIHLWVAKHDENAARMTEHEPNLRFQNGDASGLAANQSASNIESAIGSGQKLVKVVAGNPAREFRIIMLDTISVPVAERLQLCVDISNSASALNGCVHLLIIHPADSHASAVVEQNVHRLKIVDSFTGHLRMRAAGIISQHAAKCAMCMCGGIRPPGQLVRFSSVPQRVADCSRLNARELLRDIQFNDVVQVLAPVHDDRDIATLAGQTGTAAAGKNRSAELAAN